MQEREWILGHAGRRAAGQEAPIWVKHFAHKRPMVGFRDPEQCADIEQGEGSREVGDELALTPVDELVDEPVGDVANGWLQGVDVFRSEVPGDQCSILRVPRRIHGRDLLAHRQPMTVCLHEFSDVVTFEANWEARKGTAQSIARRERCGIGEHGCRFVVTSDHDDIVMRFTLDRAALPETVEVG